MENAKIAAAFVKAQKGFGSALKTSTNPHFKSKYADLSACVEAVIDSLHSNGIGLMQNTHESENGVMVETVFIHESGETISNGKLHVPASKKDPQGYGSALTYARRYSLMAACGIAPEDDDGNAASKKFPTAKITPIAGSLGSYTKEHPDDMEYLRQLAAELVDFVEGNDDAAGGYEHYEKARLDQDQKLALWEILQPHSKTRNKIKTEGAARKTKEAA